MQQEVKTVWVRPSPQGRWHLPETGVEGCGYMWMLCGREMMVRRNSERTEDPPEGDRCRWCVHAKERKP